MSAATASSARHLLAVSAVLAALAGLSLAAAPRAGKAAPDVLTSRPRPAARVHTRWCARTRGAHGAATDRGFPVICVGCV